MFRLASFSARDRAPQQSKDLSKKDKKEGSDQAWGGFPSFLSP